VTQTVDERVCRLYIFMDQALLVDLADRYRQTDGNPQEPTQLHSLSLGVCNEPIQEFTTWIFENEGRASLVTR
jgi:hypothetical protein